MKSFVLLYLLPLMMAFGTNRSQIKEKSMHVTSNELQYLVREPKDKKVKAPLLVLLHGYGSNENDLFSIANQIPEYWFVVSVRAPFAMARNQYKWYDGERIGDKIVIDLETEEISRKALIQFIDQFVLEHNVDKSKVVTAGFSQGAGLGLSVALTEPDKVLAAACFSGRVMDQVKPLIKKTKALQAKQVFVGHGTADQRSPLKKVEAHKQWLEGFGMEVSLHTYPMGHSIVNEEIEEFVKWLNAL